jgi:hypothetical protein
MDDLDAFAKRLDEEEAKAAEEEKERARQAEEARRKAEAEAQRRAPAPPPAPGATSAIAPRRPGALDMLRQTAAAPAPEDPAQQKRRAIEALDRALRAANRFLGEFAVRLSSVRPASGRPYAMQFMGTIPVSLSEARTDARPRMIEGRDYLDFAALRFNATPQPPVKLVITGDDVARFEAYLKGLKATYELQATARHDFGHVTRAIFTVKGPFPCEVMLKADYDRNEVAVELTGVRRIGKTAYRVPATELEDAVDDLGRYILGADDDFERRLAKR